MKRGIRFLCLLLPTVIFSCKVQEPIPIPSDATYFPLHIGLYGIYQVNETTYSETEGMVQDTYQLKEEVTDSFPDSNNDYTYVITLSRRNTENDPWQVQAIWSARVDGTRLTINEENTLYVKLIFPAVEGLTWNGNIYNTLGDNNYRYDSKGDSFLSFSDCLRVVEADDDNLVFTDQRTTIYARGVGVVYVARKQLNYCTSPDCLGDKTITDGIDYEQTLAEYGE